MKVLLVHNYYRQDSIGGEDVVFRNELEGLKSMLGEENVFVFTKYNDRASLIRVLSGMFFSLSAFFKVLYTIISCRIDIVHVHNTFPLISPSVFIAARIMKTPSVLTLHNFRLNCIAGTLYRNSYGVCEDCVVKSSQLPAIKYKCFRGSTIQSMGAAIALSFHQKLKLYNYVDYFFVLTKFQRRKLMDMGYDEDKLLWKPNFIAEYECSMALESDYFDFLYVGRLEEPKGILDVLQIWRDSDIPYSLGVIGIATKELDLPVHENITYLGKMNNKNVLDYMNRCKYVLQPSLLYETFGLTILEAMSTGTPVVGYDIGTRSEFIEDGTNGFLVSVHKLQKGLDRAMGFKDYSRLVECARSTAWEYRQRRILAEQIELYSNIIR